MSSQPLTAPLIFLLVVAAWVVVYVVSKLLDLKSERLTLGPLYLLLKFRAPEYHARRGKIADAALSLGAAIGFSLLVYALAFSVNNLVLFVAQPEKSTQLMLIVPGITFPVDIFIAMIPSFAVVLILHELAHFIAMRQYGVKVSSVGLALFLVIFGAFVEPDEKQFKSSSPKVRSNIAAIGSVINAAVGALAPVTLIYLPPPPLAFFFLFTVWLSLSVAIINMLPITALDGSELLSSLLEELGLKSKRLLDALSLFSIALLALNIALSWIGVG